MFEDHWYQHTSTPSQSQTPPVFVTKTALDSVPSTTRTSTNAAKRKPFIPGPPKPEVPKRATSFENLRNRQVPPQSLPINNQLPPTNPSPKLRQTYSHDDIRNLNRLQKVERSQQITSQLDFSRWYEQVEADVRNSTLDDYEVLHSILQTYVSTCDSMLEETDAGLAVLSSLETSFSAVRMHTSSFQGQCEDLIAEDQRLQALQQNLSDGLWPFNQLDGIVRKLHKPGVDFVRTEAFITMLSTLDRCISFCVKHPDFADTPTYSSRFRQCMTRALSLIRVYFVNSVKESVADIERRLASLKTPSDSTRAALLHSKFRANAAELQKLTGEIEKRCSHEEYRNILRECYSTFTSVRQRLIIPIVQTKLSQISSSNPDLVAFARTGVSYIRTVCTDESELWRAFFGGGDIERFTFLQTIFAPFNDTIKPRIAKTTGLKEICELCTLLQTTYQREQDEGDPNHFDHLHPHVEFGGLVQSTMQDTHVKIVECVKATVREQISGFTPTQDDLDYPAKLKKNPTNKPSSSKADSLAPVAVESDDVASIFDGSEMDTQAVFAGWYPTLRRAVWLLSRIYRLVNPTIFSDLAHQLVHACMASLVKASDRIKSETSLVDGQLFLIKHLLILKEQMIAFDIEYVQPQPHLPKKEEESTISVTGRLTETLWGFYEKGSFFGGSTLSKLVGAGSGEGVVDAKVELDNRLRTVITDFCAYFSSKITEYLQDSPSIALHPKAQEPMQTIEDNCQRYIPELRDQLIAYIPEQRTRDALTGAVQDQVIEAYSKYVERMVKNENRTISLDKLWDIGVFVEWAHDTFGVRSYYTESPDARSEVGSVRSGGSISGSMRST